MNLIDQGIEKELIKFSKDKKQITYINQNKSRNYSNPEEKVQAEIFLKLVLEYGYPVEHIEQFKTVTMGADKREADIIVHENAEWDKPKIVVECKKQEVSQQEFNQAINQGFSYASALSGTVKFVWITSGILNDFYRFDKEKDTREPLGELPRYGFDSVAPYKFVKGGGEREYLDEKGKKKKQFFNNIKTVSENDLTKRFKQAHDALWAGGQLNPSEAFDELDKLIFCKIWDEKYNLKDGTLKRRKKGEIYDFQVITVLGKDKEETIEKTNSALAKRVKNIYSAGRNFDKEVFKDNIRLSDSRIRTITNYLQEVNLSETDLDSKGRAFETFMGNFFRGEFGQYFTPRPIVQFIVEALPIKNTSYVLDTSCGSGGFLLHALDKVRRKADIEFPDYKTDVEEHSSWREYWHNFAENNLFGIEINEQIARTAKMNMIIHDDGHTNVIAIDGLEDETKITAINKGFKNNHFDFIITNPPFGSTIKENEKDYLKSFELGNKKPDWLDYKNTKKAVRNNQSTEVLFIEQCYNFLTEGGYLAVVLPDGILTNSSLQYVRDQIEDWYRIVAVNSMPQTAFSATGAGVKSSVLFLKKHTKEHTKKLQILKEKIQNELKTKFEYLDTISKWNTEKTKIIKDLDGFTNSTDLTIKEVKKTQEFKDWRTEINSLYNDKLKDLQEQLTEAYQKEKAKQLPDYPIFMAIAENIGYDATGKSSATLVSKNEITEANYTKTVTELSHDLFNECITKVFNIQNEEVSAKKEILKEGILKELSHFIKQIEDGRI
ncbi:N-6 DNA methylase [Tenacibaculum dicentrarchi]|nr:N-6 DNA methylase [Tenacibaculum dicentrarchi]